MSYRIYKNSINQKTSDSLFKYVLRVCNFYSPKIFKNQKYPKKWIDPKLIEPKLLEPLIRNGWMQN